MSGFRFPDGVEFLGDGGDGNVNFSVSIPVDDDGFRGRECPECEQHFRIAHEDYEALPDDLRLWCVYCGHDDDHSEFMTEQQAERVMRAAGDYAQQLVGRMLDYPAPLPEIDEERLVRERRCVGCGLRYAVFGEHRFCPVCGSLPPLTVALDVLEAETTRLDALGELPDDVLVTLRETGVVHRTYVDTIENLVGIVEVLADRVFGSQVLSADTALKGGGNVFQRLDDLAGLFAEHLAIDVRSASGLDWSSLLQVWAARHVFTHCDGIVDAKYLVAVPMSPHRVGQRLQITEADTRAAIENTRALCEALVPAPE